MHNEEKIYCSKCYKYFSGKWITRINNLLKTLILVLKRILYNKDSITKVKNIEYFEFPFTLDLGNYNYLNDINNLDKDIISEYNLKEIVIHESNVDTGYYYILTKDNNSENQIKLNDKFIEAFDIINLKNFAFGGYDAYYKYENNSSASIIIY